MKSTARPLLNGDNQSTAGTSPEYLKAAAEKTQPPPTDIVLPSCLVKNESSVLSPLIFTRKVPTIKLDPQMSPQTVMLESLLALVSKSYYRTTFDLADFFKELAANTDPVDQSKPRAESRRRNNQAVRQGKRIKKAVKLDKKSQAKEQAKDKAVAQPPDDLNVLDYLVSPIKSDFCVGRLTRKLDPEGIGGVRGGPLRLRQTVRHDRDDGWLSRSEPKTRKRRCSCTTSGRRPRGTRCGNSTGNN